MKTFEALTPKKTAQAKTQKDATPSTCVVDDGAPSSCAQDDPHVASRRGRLRLWPIFALGVLPLFGLVGVPAARVAMSPFGPVDRPLRGNARRRYRILKKIPKDPKILVNVRLEHLPSTHQMTLLGKSALPALEKGLTHNVNPTVRKRIAVVLTEMADYHSLNALKASMKDWDRNVRYTAMKALAALGSIEAKDVLEKALKDPEEPPYIKALAIRALGWIGAKNMAPRFLSILSNKKEFYSGRRAALEALWDLRGDISPKTLRRALVAGLNSNLSKNKVFAAAAVAELQDRSPQVRKALLKNIRHPNAEVRNVSVYALGEIGDRSAIKPLRKRLPAARSGRLLNNIAFALYKMQDPKVLASLGKLLQHRQAVIRLNAAFVLGDTGEKKAVPMLLKALSDGNDIVRASAVAALGKLEDTRAVAPLVRLSKTKNISLRFECLKALNAIKKGAYNNRIVKEFLASPSFKLRRMAAMELARHGDKRAINTLLTCLERGRCSPRRVAHSLEKIRSWKTAPAAVTAYAMRAGRYGEGSLLAAVTKQKKLTPGHISVLRSHLPLVWRDKGSRIRLIRALGKLHDKASRTAFWSLLKSRDRIQVLNGAHALANQGYARGVQILLRALTQGAPSTKRIVSHLIWSITNTKNEALLKKGIRKAMKGHGLLTRAAAAFVTTKWNSRKGMDILVELLGSSSRRVRKEAGYYLTQDAMQGYKASLVQLLRDERDQTKKGALRRVVVAITPARFKPKLWQHLPF